MLRFLAVAFCLLLSVPSRGVEQTNQLPNPWKSKQKAFDKLDPQLTKIGEKLFFDPILSRNRKISCATCHQPQLAYSNGRELAQGWNGESTSYNVPVLFNRFDSKLQFWDGRAHSLHDQIFQPIANPNEMGMDEKALMERLNADSEYREVFQRTITRELVENALETFIRSLVSGDSRYDQYVAGKTDVLTIEEIEGKNLFFEKYKCTRCHEGPNFTNEKLSLRCGSASKRYSTLYKVPTLRNLQTSKPYFHNGRLNKLEEVLDFYNQGNNEHGFSVSVEDQKKLILFLNTLNAPILSYRKGAGSN